jgi:hypothetical protein
VETLPINERQYVTYGQHFACITHGDYSKKKIRKISDVIRSETRTEYGTTENTFLLTGYLHHKAMDMDDNTGRVHYQAPSPVPLDSYHNQEAYIGSRRGVELLLLNRENDGVRLIHA